MRLESLVSKPTALFHLSSISSTRHELRFVAQTVQYLSIWKYIQEYRWSEPGPLTWGGSFVCI